MRCFGSLFWMLLVSTSLEACASPGDTYVISCPDGLSTPGRDGRVMLFFITETGPEWAIREPADAPFFSRPQPICSVAVRDFEPGTSITIDGSAIAFPSSLDDLDGSIRVQAVFDADDTERSFLEGPGNLVSDVVSARVSRDRSDRVEIDFSHVVEAPITPPDGENLKWIHYRSDSLSAFYGRDVFHRAGVALPDGYGAPENADRDWGVVYLVPGFGGRYASAFGYAQMLAVGDTEFTPQCVFVVLDPESSLGHHGFVDSPNHGPRGTALVEELIPYIESRFRVRVAPEGRLLYGHSSGGWSVLWLQLNWPTVFGGCWSSAPDPINFSRFQMSNLYKDRNLYEYHPGDETPSYRVVDFDGRDRVSMTVREEAMMEYAISPDGRSGQQWDAWEAMFSPRDDQTSLPKPMFDASTGEIDQDVVAHWKQFDIFERVRTNWERDRPILEQRVRLLCGEHDNYYLNRAVETLKEMVELRAGDTWVGPGYIEIIQHAAHGSLVNLTTVRIHREMIEHLRAHDLAP